MARRTYQENKAKEHREYLEKKHQAYLNSQIKEYNVAREIELLDFLLLAIKDQSKNNIKMLLTKKFIGVNGLAVSQYNYKLYKGDIVQISKVPFEKSKSSLQPLKSNLPKIEVIYEDNNYIAINKPFGLLSIESDKEKVETAYKMVLKYMQEKDKNARCFQVHRIDKDTSGVLLFVKNYELKETLQKNWNKLVKKREYLAITHGIPEKKEGRIEAYLNKDDKTNLMYDTKNFHNGALAITNYKVIKTTKQYALLDVLIETGRKNQIRVAMKDLNCPIIGDDKYGDSENPIKRLGLHASTLAFKDPISEKLITISAEIPAVFKKIFN